MQQPSVAAAIAMVGKPCHGDVANAYKGDFSIVELLLLPKQQVLSQ